MRKARFFYVYLVLLVVLLNELSVHDCAAAGQTKENKTEPEIRVALTDSDFQSVYHDSVTISLNGEETVYKAEALRGRNEIISIPEQEGGILIPSIHRQCGTPSYGGRLEIRPCEEGLLVINILPLEKYLEQLSRVRCHPHTKKKRSKRRQSVREPTPGSRCRAADSVNMGQMWMTA